MKYGMFYMFVIVVVMLFSVSGHSDDNISGNHISTCQSTEIVNDIACLIPKTDFVLKSNIDVVCRYIKNDFCIIKKSWYQKVMQILIFQKLDHLKSVKPIFLTTDFFYQRLYPTPEDSDEHFIS